MSDNTNTSAVEAAQVPLVELLQGIPKDYVAKWTDKDGLRASHSVPIGRYAHEAAAALASLQTKAPVEDGLADELAEHLANISANARGSWGYYPPEIGEASPPRFTADGFNRPASLHWLVLNADRIFTRLRLSTQQEAKAEGEAVGLLRELVASVDALPVEEMVQADRQGDPELVGYCMQAQGEWDNVRRANEAAKAHLSTNEGEGA